MNTESITSEKLEKEDNQTEKRKFGRPKSAVKRSKQMHIRLTPMERLLIEGKAREAAMPTSEWLRKAAKQAKVERRLNAEDLGVFRMLTGLANNLNQLAKMAQAGGLYSIQLQCLEILPKVEITLDKLNRDAS